MGWFSEEWGVRGTGYVGNKEALRFWRVIRHYVGPHSDVAVHSRKMYFTRAINSIKVAYRYFLWETVDDSTLCVYPSDITSCIRICHEFDYSWEISWLLFQNILYCMQYAPETCLSYVDFPHGYFAFFSV